MSSRRGGDTELDVVSILRRARDPDGLGELRRAIEELGQRDGSPQLEQLMEAVQETRSQVHAVAVAVEALAVRETGSDHLTDVTKMTSYTVETKIEGGATQHWHIAAPARTSYFAARAVSVHVVDPHDRCIFRTATIQGASINQFPLLAGAIESDRWGAPPGRGHPVGWLFTQDALIQTLEVELRNHHPFPVLVQMTLSGEPLDFLPPGQCCGSFPPDADLDPPPRPYIHHRSGRYR